MKKYIAHLLALIAIIASIILFVQNQQQQERIDTLQAKQKEIITAINNSFKMSEPSSLAKGTPAPAFSLMDSNGKTVNSADWNTDKQKVLVFSSSECSYCTDFYPELDLFTKANPQIEVYVIQDLSTTEKNKQFLETSGYTFKMLVAIDEVFNDYKIIETPTTVIINSENTIHSTFVATTAEELAKQIQ